MNVPQSNSMPAIDSQWWRGMWELPPIGMATDKDHGLFALVRTRLCTESKQERDKWIPVRDACINIFNYGDYAINDAAMPGQPADETFIINHAQGDLIGDKDVMFREPVQIEIGAEDDGSNVLGYYWNGPDQVMQPQMQVVLDPMSGQPIQQPIVDPVTGQPQMAPTPAANVYGFAPPAPDPITGEPMAQPIDQQQAEQLMNSGIPLNWITAVNNKLVSDIEQMRFDSDWRKSFADEWLDQFVMGVLKGGWNTALTQFDGDEFEQFNIPVANCFPDPTRQFVWQWDYCVIHWVLRLQTAQRLFPKYAQQLADRSQLGQPKRVDANSQMGYQYDRDFQLRTVTLSITWLKNQPIPMTEQEALSGGHVEQGVLGSSQQGQPQGTGLETGQLILPQESEVDASGQDGQTQVTPDSAGTQPYPTPIPSQPQQLGIAQETVQAPPAPPVYMLHGGNEQVNPNGPQWPMRYTLRQFIMLDDNLIEDDECPWPFIPIMHATCIPFEDTPYGFSPLWKMRFSQRADSTMADAIANNCDYFGRPPSWMAESIKARLQAKLKTAFVDPGMSLGLIPDEIDASGRPRVGFIELPAMNQHHIEGRQQMQADRKELGGYTDAIKGIPVTGNAPAELQKVTMAAASGVISSISKHLQGSIKHMAMLRLYAQIHFGSFEAMWKCCKKYRRDVLAAIHLKHAPEISWKVDAMLASGAGSQRTQRRNDLFMLNQAPNKLVDDESVQEAWGLDPVTIRERKEREMQAQAALMPQPSPVGSGQSEQQPAEAGGDERMTGFQGER